MSKSLTEKWKDRELQFGKTYWCSDDEGNIAKLVLVSKDRFYEWTLGTEVTKDVKEVLAPVPSYEEYMQLQKENDRLSSLIIDVNNKWLKTIKEKKKLQAQVKMVEWKGKVK